MSNGTIPSRRALVMSGGNSDAEIVYELTDNLEAYWKLDETSGVRYDQTANDYDLQPFTTFTNLEYYTGIIGNAVNFRPNVQEHAYLERTTGTPVHFQGDTTLSIWSHTHATAAERYIAAVYYSTNERAWRLNHTGTGQQVTLTLSSDGAAVGVTTLGDAAWTTWVHVVLVWDESANTMTPFVDGTKGTPFSPPGTGIHSAAADFMVGTYGIAGTPGAYYSGAVDEMGVWSRALSDSEVAELYNSGSGLAYPFT